MTSVALGQVEIDDRGFAFVGRTRMIVSQIVAERQAGGLTPEEIAQNHDSITLSEVYTAFADDADHSQTIDAELAATTQLVAQSRELSAHPPDLRERLERRRQADSRAYRYLPKFTCTLPSPVRAL